MNKLTIHLETDDPLRQSFHLRILLRAFLESKWSEQSYDEELLGSELLAMYCTDIVKQIDELEDRLFGNAHSPCQTWLTISDSNNRIYETMLRKVLSLKRHGQRVYPSDDPTDIQRMVEIYFSPYRVAPGVIAEFIRAVESSK